MKTETIPEPVAIALLVGCASVDFAHAGAYLNAEGTLVKGAAAQAKFQRAKSICLGEMAAAENAAGPRFGATDNPFDVFEDGIIRRRNNEAVMIGCMMRYGFAYSQTAR